MEQSLHGRKHTLTKLQKNFIDEYLADPSNATEAARKAGSKSKEPWKVAHQLLKNIHVINSIADRRKQLMGEDGQKPERTVRELELIAFGNIQEVYNPKGELIPIQHLDPHIAASIASIEVTEKLSSGKTIRPIAHIKKIKMWDKLKALDMICRILGMYNDKVDIPGLKEFLEAMSEIDGNTKGKLPV